MARGRGKSKNKKSYLKEMGYIAEKDKNKRRQFYVSPMEIAEEEHINALLSTTEKLQLIALVDTIGDAAKLWGDNINGKRFNQNQKSKFVNMRKTLRNDLIEKGYWSKADYEYACWCLWFLDELKNEEGNLILLQYDDLADLQCDLLEKATEGIVDDYINSELRYNHAMLHKNITIE